VRPFLSLTLNPSPKSGYVALPPNVLAGLDIDDDMSPKSSFLYDATIFWLSAKSLAVSRDSIQSSAEILPDSVDADDFVSSNE
jgi:hypothetical protein